MKKDAGQENPLKIRRTFYLTRDVDEWLVGQAKGVDRSVSYYLDSLLKRERDAKRK